MTTLTYDQALDVKGLNCPMPLLKSRKAMKSLEVGQVLKIISTDRGSIKDFQGWTQTAKDVELLNQVEESSDGTTLYTHFVRRTK